MPQDLHAVKLAAERQILASYGLHKLANAPPGIFRRAANRLFRYRQGAPNESTARGLVGGVGDMARDVIFGSPLSFKDQLLKRRAETGGWGKAIARHFGEFYVPRSTGSIPMDVAFRGMSLGVPAYELYGAATTENPEVRRQRMAGALAGLAVAPVTSYFGLPGVMASGAVSNLASKAVART
jgi:hypothetical protein